MKHNYVRKTVSFRPLSRLSGISLRDLAVSVGPLILLTVIAIVAAYWLIRPAPPTTIVIASGPKGSTFRITAEKYQKILARKGVTLKILPTEGSSDNLKKLNDPTVPVDVGFVQGGLTEGKEFDKLVSLGSLFHEPLFLFYHSNAPVALLSGFNGKRIAIGPDGSGTHALAMILLKANGIEPAGSTVLINTGGEEAAQALISGKIDAAFLMGDSATPPVIRTLLSATGIRLLNFVQADAYTRRYPYLFKVDLPMGAFDFGKNVPPQDVSLIAPTVELVARDTLHPALSDLLIEAAREVHGGAKLLQRAGEFPAPLEHEYLISADARRYYTSGKSFFYRYLPFWLASLVDRLLVVVVPIVVLLIPGLKLVPALYNWRIRSRINRWYGILINLERDMLADPSPDGREELLKKFDIIEANVNKMKIPLAFTEQFYVLRDHINFVRERYNNVAEKA
jgi:TRAP transporter TAXI family solute receptor